MWNGKFYIIFVVYGCLNADRHDEFTGTVLFAFGMVRGLKPGPPHSKWTLYH